MPSELVAQLVAAGGTAPLPSRVPLMTPIETPLVFSGFTAETLNTYEPLFRQMGIAPVQGGASAGTLTAKPAAGWEHALNPGEAVSGILVSGDMSTTGMGTVTYNDGKRILAFGHQFFDLGPVDMPIAKSEILTVLSSAYQPNKVGNATEVVGALRQDRFTGIMGELGAEAPVIPVHVQVRAHGENDAIVKEKDLNFNVFVHQKWTPFLMSATLSNSLQQMNLYADEMTYRMTGDVMMDGSDNIHVSTMLAPGEFPVPMPTVLAGWWGDKFNRLFLNNVATPKLKSVDADHRSAARPPRRHHRNRVDAHHRSRSRHRDPRESLPAPLSRRKNRALAHREDSRRDAQRRTPLALQRRRYAWTARRTAPPRTTKTWTLPPRFRC